PGSRASRQACRRIAAARRRRLAPREAAAGPRRHAAARPHRHAAARPHRHPAGDPGVSAADGSITGTQKIVDHGPDAERYNIVILGDGYRASEMAKYHADVQAFVDVFGQTAPFGDLWCGINIHRVDVVSTDSGADDPVASGDGSAGSGAVARTYFDATFC